MMSASKKKPRNQQTEVLELNENENTAQQNLWDTLKAALQGKFIGLNLVPTVKKGIRKNTNKRHHGATQNLGKTKTNQIQTQSTARINKNQSINQ